MTTTYELATQHANPGLPDGCSQSDIDDAGAEPVTFDELTKREQMMIDQQFFADNYGEILDLIDHDGVIAKLLAQHRAELTPVLVATGKF